MALLLLITILGLFSGCGYSLGGRIEGGVFVPSPSSPFEDMSLGPVEFAVVPGDSDLKYSSRVWKVEDGVLPVEADVTGDGVIDRFFLSFAHLDGLESPRIERGEGGYLVTLPGDIPEEVKIGDGDGDGDADIVLGEGHLLRNTGLYLEKGIFSDEEFVSALGKIDGLINSGREYEAYRLAFGIALGTPHDWSASGEGEDGRYDRDPEYSLSSGNCVTWVEQILAMVNSGGTFDGFMARLRDIRYYNGQRDYVMRKHFQEADWIPDNTAIGYIYDLLPAFSEDVLYAEGEINKPNWYAAKEGLEGDFSDLSDEEILKRISEFQKEGAYMGSETVSLGYVPFERMARLDGEKYSLDPAFIDRLPVISVFNVVNKGLIIKDSDGNRVTDLLVSHVGFIVKEPDGRVLIYHSTNKTDAALSIMAQEELLSFISHRYLSGGGGTAVGLHLSEPLTRISATSAMKAMVR